MIALDMYCLYNCVLHVGCTTTLRCANDCIRTFIEGDLILHAYLTRKSFAINLRI